jgi:hypothetical protein
MTLIAAWNFDNPSEGATVYDDVGAHNGSMIGTVATAPGPVSSVKRVLPGVSGDRLEVPTSTSFELTTNRTIELWAGSSLVDGSLHHIVLKSDGSKTPISIGTQAITNYWFTEVSDGTTTISAVSTVVPVVDIPYYLAIVWNVTDKELILYVNVKREASGIDGAFVPGDAANTQPIQFSSSSNPWNGPLHSVSIRDVARSPRRIYNTYNGSSVLEVNS